MLVLLIATAGGLFPATSRELGNEYDRWVHRSWTTANGLPQDTVYALAQAADGCLWIGCEGGLARFDGANFTVYRKNTTPGLASDSITSLAADPDGSLWVGTASGGLLRFKDGRFVKIEGLPDDRIWSLRRDCQGTLWVIPYQGSAYCLEKGRRPAQAVIDDLPDPQVTAVAGSMADTLWIGTRGGLAAIRQGWQTVFTTRKGLAGNFIYCLFTDSRGSLWAGTTTGLSRIDGKGMRRYSIADGLASDMVLAVGEDAQGRIWIGTDKGVTIMEPGEKGLCVSPQGLAGDAVMAISRDRENCMWIGWAAGGLSFLKRNEVRVFATKEGLSGRQVTAICQDRRGRLWVGTRGQGLNRLESGKWRSYANRDGLAGTFITSLLADRLGRIWIGTLDAGLQVMTGEKFAPVRSPTWPAGHAVLALFSDQQGDVWIGTNGNGLDRYHEGEFQHHGATSGLKGSVITALGEDRQGAIWAGSARDGLHVLRGERWRRYTTADGLAGDTVYAIHADGAGGLWLGTDNGLGLYRQGRFITFREAAGPLNGAILSILEDASGRLWMSSPTGIFSARRSELVASAGGRAPHCRLFGEMSGLLSSVCPGGFQPASCRDLGGRLWFPTQNGLVEIDPMGLGAAPPAPLPRLEAVQGDGLTVSLADGSVIPAGTTSFDFHYAAAAFSDPGQVEFSTQLQGREDGWSRPSRERRRHISGVRAGPYAFRVRARGQSGAWSKTEAIFRFTIAPRFQQTRGFYLLLLAGCGSVAAGFLFYRRNRARRRREDRYKSSPLSSDKTAEYAVRIERAMKKDKLFLDPELTLAKLAEATAIPAKPLSQVVNEHFQMNFNDFINRCRIDEAKCLLLDPATRDFKLLRIAFESGFNSKSVFNGAFRKNTGLSPSEFRRLLGGKDSGAAG